METMSMFAKKEDLFKAKAERLEMENAALIEFLTEIGNEYFEVNEDGSFSGRLATKLNRLLGI